MKTIHAYESQKILDTLKQNIESFRILLETIDDDVARQNILRSMLLFACFGIDAIVKQLINEALSLVIEREIGAQEQLKKYTSRELKKDSDYTLTAELLTVKDSRKWLIERLKVELSINSLQSADQLYKVASYFNISTEKLVDKDNKAILKDAFHTRNIIVHQMDIDLANNTVNRHEIKEINDFVQTIYMVANNFITEVNNILCKPVTDDYAPMFSFENGVFSIRSE